MSIPSKEEWGVIQKGSLDEEHAYKQFFGLSVAQAQEKFKAHALFYQEDLYYMPPAVFSYYVRAYINYIKSEDAVEDSDGASALIQLVNWTLEEDTVIASETIKRLVETAAFVSNKQAYYAADVDIYGCFKEAYKKIARLHKSI